VAEHSIFICYRREDSIAYAGRLSDHLGAHFGTHRVFMDLDAIKPGDDFIAVLERRVAKCEALIAVIGKGWIDSRDDEGRRRLDDPEDYVRREIAAALDRRVRVIPALVGGARMPRSNELPSEIGSLARRNAIEITDSAFASSVARLIDTLEAVFKDDSGKRYDSEAIPAILKQPLPAPEVPTPTVVRPPSPIAEKPAAVPEQPVAAKPATGPTHALDRRVLAGAAVLLLVGIAAVAFLARGRESSPPATNPVATTASASNPARSAPVGADTTNNTPDATASGQFPLPLASGIHVGTVADVDTGGAVGGATVRVENGGVQTLTSGRQGEFHFTRQPGTPNEARIHISAPGYMARTETVDLSVANRHLFQLRRQETARVDPTPPPAPPPSNVAPATRSVAATPPMRVGGNIKAPVKTRNVAPLYPAAAQATGVQGVVIIELTIGPKGTVREARVLRSIPMLDQAALDAVRQWEYTPTLLNGIPVPVVMTVTVQFRLVDPRKEAINKYVSGLEASNNVGAATDLLNRVFHVHPGGFTGAVVFSTLRARIEKATDAELAEVLKAINPQ
jgi:TonB family protein